MLKPDMSQTLKKKASRDLAITGRLPWYSKDGKPHECYVIGVAGGSASGKTSVSRRIIRHLGVPWVVLVSMDSFYKNLTPQDLIEASKNEYNFDHPNSFDFEIMLQTIAKLKEGKRVDVPIYDFATHQRAAESTSIYGANIIVLEGILTLFDKRCRDLMDLKLFVDTDDDVRLARRLKRDVAERGRTIDSILGQYIKFVKPSFDDFVLPTIKHADVIIPRGVDNIVALDLITKHIARELFTRGYHHRGILANEEIQDLTLSKNVIQLEKTNWLKALHTIIRDKNTSRHDFIFYVDRLAMLVIERGLQELSFKETTVITPTGSEYTGKVNDAMLSVVSIVRAGGILENGIKRTLKDAKIGKVLIQTNSHSGEPELHFCKIPNDIGEGYVFLMDATIATGAAAIMAIRILLDHEVSEEKIVLLTLISSPSGLRAINKAFPKVRIVSSEVDTGLNDMFFIIPGIGNMGGTVMDIF